jgi:hypothetical protein
MNPSRRFIRVLFCVCFCVCLCVLKFVVAQTQATITTVPEFLFVEEMGALPFSEGKGVSPFLCEGSATAALLPGFKSAWASAALELDHGVSTATLGAISRWAKAETVAAQLPASWPQQLFPYLAPVASAPESDEIWLFHDISHGIPLPSHHPLVFRRLMIGVAVRKSPCTITKIVVTIRGWREE